MPEEKEAAIKKAEEEEKARQAAEQHRKDMEEIAAKPLNERTNEEQYALLLYKINENIELTEEEKIALAVFAEQKKKYPNINLDGSENNGDNFWQSQFFMKIEWENKENDPNYKICGVACVLGSLYSNVNTILQGDIGISIEDAYKLGKEEGIITGNCFVTR